MASSNKTSHLPIKSILKNGNNDRQTFPGKIPAKYHGNSDAALSPHSGCKVSNSTCSVSCGVSHIQGFGCCVNSRPGPTCCVRERERTLSALSARGSARRSCSEPCSDNGQARSLAPLQRPAAAEGLTGVSQVSFHPVVEKFRPNGDSEYINLSVSSTPGRVYHPERQSSRVRRPMVKRSTRKCCIDSAAQCWNTWRGGDSHLVQTGTQVDREAQSLPVGAPQGPEQGTGTSSSAPDPRSSPGYQEAAPTSKTDAFYLG